MDLKKITVPTITCGVCVFVGVMIGVEDTPESVIQYPSTKQEVITKTVYVDVPKIETKTVYVDVPKIETKTVYVDVPAKNDNATLPESCVSAIKMANRVSSDVSPVAETMGNQKLIASKAREAISDSNFLTLGSVMQEQSQLESSLSGNYLSLANHTGDLNIFLEQCNKEQ